MRIVITIHEVLQCKCHYNFLNTLNSIHSTDLYQIFCLTVCICMISFIQFGLFCVKQKIIMRSERNDFCADWKLYFLRCIQSTHITSIYISQIDDVQLLKEFAIMKNMTNYTRTTHHVIIHQNLSITFCLATHARWHPQKVNG